MGTVKIGEGQMVTVEGQITLVNREEYLEKFMIDKKMINIAKGYAKLATRTLLSDGEAELMGEILELAEFDETLSLFINEIDNLVDQKFNSIDDVVDELTTLKQDETLRSELDKAKVKLQLMEDQLTLADDDYSFAKKTFTFLNRQDKISIGYSADSGYFKGEIDEVRVWNVAKTQVTFQASLSQKLTGNEQGLIGYWNFEESAGNTVYDLTANKNNGTLTNGVQRTIDSSVAVPQNENKLIIWNDDIQNEKLNNDIYITNSGANEIAKLMLKEYTNLATRSELFDEEAERILEILEIAESDQTLAFLINEVDNLINQELHLMNSNNIDYYENQKIQLTEFIGVQLENNIPDYFNIQDYRQKNAQTIFTCKCQESGEWITIVRTNQQEQDIPLIIWKSDLFISSKYTPENRCKEVSKRLQTLYEKKQLKYLTTQIINTNTVLCFTKQMSPNHENCALYNVEDLDLLTLNPNKNPDEILKELIAINFDDNAVDHEYDSEGHLYINIEYFLSIMNNKTPQTDLRGLN